MNKSILKLALMLALILSAAAPLVAHTPLGGLAVAVSPDGKTIVAGGDSRTLYIIDGGSLAVQKRVWFKTTIFFLTFNKDGSRLVVEDTKEKAHFVDTKTWEVVKTVDKCAWIAPARNVDLFASIDGNWKGQSVVVRSLTDGAEKARVTFAKKIRISSVGLNAEGTRLAVLLQGKRDKSEPKARYKDIPKSLKGAAREEFKQKNDERTSVFYVYEVPSGKKLLEKPTYYCTSSGALVFFEGKAVRVANYSNVNALFAEDGTATVWKQVSSFNYGKGLSPDQKVLWGGGMTGGSKTVIEGLVGTKFRTNRLPGWPEYFKSFATGPDGIAYGTTSAYRLFRFTANGGVDKAVPIY